MIADDDRHGLTPPTRNRRPRGWVSGWATAGTAAATAVLGGIAIWLSQADEDAGLTTALTLGGVVLTALLGVTTLVAQRARQRDARVADERAWQARAEALLQVATRDGRLPRLSELDDHDLGVTPTRYTKAGNAPYVPRRLSDLRMVEALTTWGPQLPFVVLVGSQKAGKSRTAAHAARVAFGERDPQVVVPGRGEAAAAIARLDPALPIESPPALLWLDDVTATELQHFAGPVLHELRRRMVIVATMASKRYVELAAAEHDTAVASRALRSAVCLDLPFELTSSERDAARGAYPQEVMSESIGETLVGAQDLLAKYRHGGDAVDSPGRAGQALVRAAVDFRRVGMTRSITTAELRRLFDAYLLAMYPHLEASAQRFEMGLDWATEPVASRVALLQRRTSTPDAATYDVLDYIVGADDDVTDTFDPRPIPATTWHEAITLVAPDEAYDIGSAAMIRNRPDVAIEAFGRCGEGGGGVAPLAALHLGRLLRITDPARARVAFGQALDSGHDEAAPAAALDLGTLLEEAGDAEAAVGRYGVAVESGHPEWAPRAMVRIAGLLEATDADAARAMFRRAVESRHAEMAPAAALRLGAMLETADADAATDAYRRAMSFGHDRHSSDAAVRLGRLLEGRGDRAGAGDMYKAAIAAGHPEHASQAAIRLALMIAPESDHARTVLRAALDDAGDRDLPDSPARAGARVRSGRTGGSDRLAGFDRPADTVIPDQDLVKQLLEQMELKFVIDDEGDLAAPWEQFRTYFMFRGDGEQQVFSVRTFYDRDHPVSDLARIREVIDDWNRRTLWPKVYTHLDAGNPVRLVGECQTLIGAGVDLEHFVSSTVSWVRASVEFDTWLVEQLDLP